MPLLGLIGNPVAHSRSPELFKGFFYRENIKDWDYRLFPLDTISQLTDLLNTRSELVGFNVTVPFKKDIMQYLDVVSEEAAEVGAVNTVVVERKGAAYRLLGYNTDVFGFDVLLQSISNSAVRYALVLGTGGSAKAVSYVLNKYAIQHEFVSRASAGARLTYADIDEVLLNKTNLIVNTTPLGMWPNEDTMPSFPVSLVAEQHILIDLVYNPQETKLMQAFKKQGATVGNGMLMLEEQAARSWKLWKNASGY